VQARARAIAPKRAFISAINSDLRRRAQKRKLRGRLQTGCLTVVQRLGSSQNLNIHFHAIVMFPIRQR
jgi:hypothetical protein